VVEELMAGNYEADGITAPIVDGAGARIAIVVARFNSGITTRLLSGARDALRGAGVADGDVTEVWVPGAFEIPLAANALASSGRHDAVICLGCVIRGETAHFEHVAGQCAAGVMRVALDTERPVAFGVLTTENVDQALARSAEPGAGEPGHGDVGHNVGADCAGVVLEMLAVLRTASADG
jgi:6,7-dimethyl-8-ribityllumazine synthase